MDTRPIGVFDSGLGGLTALRELARIMPEEDLVYFGDTGRVPYGGRSREILVRYARQDVAFLRSFQPKAVVIACGTVSTTALDVLREENDIPIFGVVESAAHAAAQLTRNGRVGLIGTKASIRSGAYERALAALRPGVEVTARACPLLVPLVEDGRFRPGDSVAETVVAEYLAPVRAAGVDTLILGCTHYPLMKPLMGAYMGPDTALVDVGEQCARWVKRQLELDGLRNGRPGAGRRRFFVSDSTEDFSALASVFLGEDVRGGVEQIDITAY
ncbi:MAG: glutamate racemase [Oscillospiraceae bacterium]|nr:glutamate racemase [Oscillospiraceae bacterium]MDE6839382.1 glutamate racemase [Oscillospiraceae bacterium]